MADEQRAGLPLADLPLWRERTFLESVEACAFGCVGTTVCPYHDGFIDGIDAAISALFGRATISKTEGTVNVHVGLQS